jgi:hypothetical protein
MRQFHRAIVLLVATLVISGESAVGQLQNSQWVFGSHARLSFPSNGPPISVGGSAMLAPEGCASIADRRTGELLFYSNGAQLWNRFHQVMPGGDSLAGGISSLQSVIIVPDPATEARYYVFTTDHQENGYRNGLRYSIVDMRLDGGRGDVLEKNTIVVPPVGERLCAVRSCSEDRYWVVTFAGTTHSFYAVSVTSAGVSAPVVSPMELPEFGIGELRASHRGDMLVTSVALSDGFGTECGIRFLRFDQSSGRISHILTTGPSSIGFLCFSPDERFLYLSTGSQIVQYDVSVMDSASIELSADTVFETSAYVLQGIQAGPDGRIYVSVRNEPFVAVIEVPNVRGSACSFRLDGVRLSAGVGRFQLPNVVSALNTLSVDAGDDRAICAGDSVALRGSGGMHYRWTPSAFLSCSDCPDPVAFPISTTTYRLTVTNAFGCVATDTVVVNVGPAVQADAGRDTILCRGSSTRLRASGGISYSWSPPTGLSCTDCAEPVARPDETTLYHVMVVGDGGCSSEDSVLVTVANAIVADAGRDTSTCEGVPVPLLGSDAARWRWSPSRGLSCTDCQSPMAAPDSTTRYRVEVWNEAGCRAFDEVVVTVLKRPALRVASDSFACAGSAVKLIASGARSYRWDDSPELSCIDCPDPVARPSKTTTYALTAIGENGCVARDSVTIVVKPRPELLIAGDSLICRDGSAKLTAQGADAYRWWASSGSPDCPTCSEQLVSPGTSTTYFVEGWKDGCVAIDSFTVTVIDRPEIALSGGGEICRGGQTRLVATGATEYRWEPSDGLDCTDCAMPIAAPSSTTTYRVIGRLSGGCADTATTTVTVVVPKLMLATIERGLKVLPGASGALHLALDQPLFTDSIAFEITWNRNVAAVDGVAPQTMLARDGWTIAPTTHEPGRYSGVLHRATPSSIGPGDIIEIAMTAFLGDSASTEVMLAISPSPASCATFATQAGQVLVDSICGMSFRLIEASDELLTLSAPVPNPITNRSTVTYTLPFDAEIELQLVDARGIARTIDAGHRSKGRHDVGLDASDIDAGVYELRLKMGESHSRQSVVVVN